ncbi:MAG: hypothetical protein A2X97_10320 [Bdellovibrionales bacterium GWA1_52_35]|nr:MAG: hypothetical protein A2X97_10320 [Bdellovibrionales bacterium GWA1_52_35]
MIIYIVGVAEVIYPLKEGIGMRELFRVLSIAVCLLPVVSIADELVGPLLAPGVVAPSGTRTRTIPGQNVGWGLIAPSIEVPDGGAQDTPPLLPHLAVVTNRGKFRVHSWMSAPFTSLSKTEQNCIKKQYYEFRAANLRLVYALEVNIRSKISTNLKLNGLKVAVSIGKANNTCLIVSKKMISNKVASAEEAESLDQPRISDSKIKQIEERGLTLPKNVHSGSKAATAR